jgi:hypothetical protein
MQVFVSPKSGDGADLELKRCALLVDIGPILLLDGNGSHRVMGGAARMKGSSGRAADWAVNGLKNSAWLEPPID